MPWDFWLIFVVLGVFLPLRGRLRLQKLLALPQIGRGERLSLYASTIAFQWLAAGVVAWRAWARGLTLDELGLVFHGRWRILIAAIVGAATLGSLQWLNLRRMGRSSGKAREFMKALAERILPQSSVELLPYFALALTAGLCEEFLYRGFAMAALTRAGLPVWGVVLLSSVFFGLAHLYQGRGGLVSTLVIGTVFGTARIAYDGLAPVMLWHFAVDAVAGVAGPKFLLKGVPPTGADSGPRNSQIVTL
jgi:membrane protease YdiL (CAAX protease family)